MINDMEDSLCKLKKSKKQSNVKERKKGSFSTKTADPTPALFIFPNREQRVTTPQKSNTKDLVYKICQKQK